MYATRDDMIARFTETEIIDLTDRNDDGDIDDAILETHLSDASAEINTYLSRYQLPLSVVPPVITAKCCDMARYYLYGDDVTEIVQKRYDQAVAYLTRVSKGIVSLGLTGADKPNSGTSSVMTSGGRVFARSNNGFI